MKLTRAFPAFSYQISNIQHQMNSKTLPLLDPSTCIFSSLGSTWNSEADMQKRKKAVKIRVIDVGVRYPSEWYKTITMFFYAGCSLLLSSSLIFLSKKWGPTMHDISTITVFPPIYIRDASWAFDISRIASSLLVTLWLLQWFLLRYR